MEDWFPMWMRRPFVLVDKLVFNVIKEPTPEEMKEFENVALNDSRTLQQRISNIVAAFSAIDSKASAILVHVTLMATIMSVLSLGSSAGIIKVFSYIEICFCLIITIPCLRCLRMTSDPAGYSNVMSKIKNDAEKIASRQVITMENIDVVEKEFVIRRAILNCINIMTFYNTIFVIAIVVVKMFVGENK